MGKPDIRRIAPKPQRLKRVRVAAYARVSTDHERQLSSIAAQVSYYSHLIHSTLGWECSLTKALPGLLPSIGMSFTR